MPTQFPVRSSRSAPSEANDIRGVNNSKKSKAKRFIWKFPGILLCEKRRRSCCCRNYTCIARGTPPRAVSMNGQPIKFRIRKTARIRRTIFAHNPQCIFRLSAGKKMLKTLLITDLDGPLLLPTSFSFSDSSPALNLSRERGIAEGIARRIEQGSVQIGDE